MKELDQYVAQIQSQGRVIEKITGSDKESLFIKVLCLLDSMNNATLVVVKDRLTGQVVFRSAKSAVC